MESGRVNGSCRGTMVAMTYGTSKRTEADFERANQQTIELLKKWRESRGETSREIQADADADPQVIRLDQPEDADR